MDFEYKEKYLSDSISLSEYNIKEDTVIELKET